MTASAFFLVLFTGQSHAQMWSARKDAPEATATETPQPSPELKLFPNGTPVHVEDTPEGLANLTAQGCNGCHFSIHDDWSGSAHALAGRSKLYVEALHRAADSTACSQCHLPIVAQHDRLAAGYIDGDLSRPVLQPNKAFDATLMSEGVGCAACHVRDGVIVSTRSIDGAPHPVVRSSELSDSSFCANCHQLSFPASDMPYYNTYGEWKATPYASNGVRCHDCHMPPKPGVATATRFAASPDHSIQADLNRALTVLVDLENRSMERGAPTAVSIKVQNTGAAHHVPTGNPHKELVLNVVLMDAQGTPLVGAHTEKLRRTVSSAAPYKTTADTRIPAGGEHEFSTVLTVPHKATPGPVELRVTGTTGGPTRTLLSIPLELR